MLYETNDIVGFHLRLSHVTQCCVFYYFQKNRILAPAWKRISQNINDKAFFDYLKNVLTEIDDLKKYKKLCELIDYTAVMLEK